MIPLLTMAGSCSKFCMISMVPYYGQGMISMVGKSKMNFFIFSELICFSISPMFGFFSAHPSDRAFGGCQGVYQQPTYMYQPRLDTVIDYGEESGATNGTPVKNLSSRPRYPEDDTKPAG